ncbi:MAG: septal ring lytic transglycosylase RlpA family protein [Candidatus Kapaibacterium sp.]
MTAIAFAASGCAVRPNVTSAKTQEGIASYYSNDFQGRRTADGEIFDNSKFTAAHRTYPFGTVVRVMNLATDAAVDVRINDRGPVKQERLIDLTQAAAKALGIIRTGLGRVKIDVIEWGNKKL